MNREIRCEWTDRYPIDSCHTRILTANGERMDRSSIVTHHSEYKYTRKPLSEEQKKKYRESRIGKVRIRSHGERFTENLPDEI